MKKDKISDVYKKDASKLLEDAVNPRKKDVKMLADGWRNSITSLGTTQDKSMYNEFRGYNILTWETLSRLWVGDGFAKRIVSVVADDMTREWIYIENDIENVIKNKLDKLGTQKAFNLALKWKRLFGGSIIIMGIDDGRELDEPVNMNGIKSVDYLRVFDRTDVSLTNFNFNQDLSSKEYGAVEYYSVTPRYGSVFNVHRDRILEFKGIPVPSRLENDQWWYWGMSILQPIWEDLKDFSSSRKHVNNILYEFVIGVYNLSGLEELISEGNEERLKIRMNAIDLCKSIINAVILGDEEEYKRLTSSVAGLADILDRFMMYLSGVSGIPGTRLFGRSPSGMNATGESDLMNYYDMIVPEQNNDMKVPLQKLVENINMSKEIGNKKVDVPVVKFNKLFQLTEQEEINNRDTQSVIDERYINLGVLSSEEVRISRFENGYNYDTELIEVEEFEEEMQIEEEMEEVNE